MAENNQQVINALKEANKNAAVVIKDELKDQFKPFTDKLSMPLNQIKAGIEAIPGIGVTKKLFSAVSTPIKGLFTFEKTKDKKGGAAEAEEKNRLERLASAETTLFQDIRDGIFGIQDGLVKGLAGLKGKGLMGLGILAGLIAAPFAALVAFFSQLGREVKALGRIVGVNGEKIKGIFRSIGKIFSTIKEDLKLLKIDKAFLSIKNSVNTKFTNLANSIKKSTIFTKVDDLLGGIKSAFNTRFTKIGDMLANSKVFKSIDNTVTRFDGVGTKIADAAKATAGFIKRFTIIDTIVDTVKGFINPIKNAFTAIKTGSDTLKPFMAGFQPIMDFAKRIGTVLGKIFLPITFLMSVFDFVTGFMDGYDEGGVMGGLEGGITKLFQGIIGMPLDLLKSGVGYILGFFGFDNAKAALDKFSFSQLIDDLVGAIFSGLQGTFNFLAELFDFSDLSIFSVFSKLIDIVFLPLNLAINFVKDLFLFTNPNEPFSLGDLVMSTITSIMDFFKGLINIDIGKLVDNLPGPAKSVLKALGIIDETSSDIQAKIAEAQDRVARSEAGENVYFGREGKGREEDAEEIAELQRELERMKAQGSGTVIVNNTDASTVSTNTASTSMPAPIRDTSPPAGSVPSYG